MYISLRIRKRVMLCVIAVLSMLAAVAVMPTFAKEEKTENGTGKRRGASRKLTLNEYCCWSL